MTLVTPPVARPNSASKLLVLTSTVWMASCGGISTWSRPVRSLSSTPSSCRLLPSRDCPLKRVARLTCGLKNAECCDSGSAAPGTRIARLWKFLLPPIGKLLQLNALDLAARIGALGLQHRGLD